MTERRQEFMGAMIRSKIVSPIKQAGKRCLRSLARDLSFKRAKSDGASDASAAAVDLFVHVTSVFANPKYTTHPASRFIRSFDSSAMKNMTAIVSPIKDTQLLEMQHCISYLSSRSQTEFLTCDSWFRVPANPNELTSIIRLGHEAYFRAASTKDGHIFLVAQYLTHLLSKVPHAVIPESVQRFVMDVHATGMFIPS
ncbi:hypothetical protein BJ741DRAFT_682618 [Chytriomyces cf. hyalinus JEL632]|nr:hypothetical protein BJ741DRAFT_682618 [Chytriomyces cf. hyalinus JEL632]